MKIYAFPIALLTVHKLEQPRRGLGTEQFCFRLIFKLKEKETHRAALEHSKKSPF